MNGLAVVAGFLVAEDVGNARIRKLEHVKDNLESLNDTVTHGNTAYYDLKVSAFRADFLANVCKLGFTVCVHCSMVLPNPHRGAANGLPDDSVHPTLQLAAPDDAKTMITAA